MSSKLLDFLFGKEPKIFNKEGQVQHDLGRKTWEAWQNRRKSDPQMNWHNHSGTRAKTNQKGTNH